MMISPALIYDTMTNATDAQGNFTPMRALAQLYTKGAVRSQLLPSIALDFDKLAQPSSGPPPLALRLLRPAVALSGPAGQMEIAPYGQPTALGRLFTVALVAGLVLGPPFALGYAFGKNSRR